jgi:hypothetical protein
MLTKKLQKVATKYLCKACDYDTCRKSSYTKHLLTAKHEYLTGLNKNATLVAEEKSNDGSSHYCETCSKPYKSRAGLWYHNRKCFPVAENTMVVAAPAPASSQVSGTIDNNLVIELIRQNGELQKQLMEMAREPKIINHGTVNNNKFNLQIFLNETCKDAINASQFIDNIRVSFEDIENLGNKGYVQGITDIIVKELKTMEVTKRPFHCTDVKRETMYIKENDAWNKDNEELSTMKNVITQVSNKNKVKTGEWCQTHPDIRVLDSPDNKIYLRLFEYLMAQPDENKEKNKIIKLLAKTVHIEQNKNSLL